MKTLYDIEIYSNFFMLGLKDFVTKDNRYYEVSERRDDRIELFRFLMTYKGFMVSFNGVHYDRVVLCYIVKNWDELKRCSPNEFCSIVKSFSNSVIQDRFDEIRDYRWGWNKEWIEVDLFCHWSKMLRQSKKISLKSLGVQLGFDEIQELPYKHDSILEPSQMEEIVKYNQRNDLGILNLLCQRQVGEIKLRKEVKDTYGFGPEVYSWDAPKIANEILLDQYCKLTGKWKKEVREQRFEIPDFTLGRLLPKVDFKTKIFQDFYQELKVSKRTFSKTLVYIEEETTLKVSWGIGGIHSIQENEIFKSDESSIIYTSDVSAMYPTALLNYSFIRPELTGLLEVYGKIRQQRIEAKRNGEKMKDAFLKLCINSTTGLLDNSFSWMYSPEEISALRVTGQLVLTRLLEELSLNGFKVVSLNTDGCECIVRKGREKEYENIVELVGKEFNMTFEHDQYEYIIYRSVNSYLAKTISGKLKKKGEFVTEPELGNSVDELVIPKCLELYFVKGIRPEEVMKNPTKYGLHIYDWCRSNKISRDYTVWHNGEIQQNLNRYYVSKNAPYLYKKKNSKDTMDNVLKGWGVQLFNKYEDKPFEDYRVDTSYYLSQIRKIIHELEPKQLQLF